MNLLGTADAQPDPNQTASWNSTQDQAVFSLAFLTSVNRGTATGNFIFVDPTQNQVTYYWS